MESTSENMRIQCTDMTYRLLRDSRTHVFDLESRGSIEVKGKGKMSTWFINDAKESLPGERDKMGDSMERVEEGLPSADDLHLYDEMDT